MKSYSSLPHMRQPSIFYYVLLKKCWSQPIKLISPSIKVSGLAVRTQLRGTQEGLTSLKKPLKPTHRLISQSKIPLSTRVGSLSRGEEEHWLLPRVPEPAHCFAPGSGAQGHPLFYSQWCLPLPAGNMAACRAHLQPIRSLG